MTTVEPISRDRSDRQIEAQARAWVIRLTEEPAAAEDCDAWRALDPSHDEAFREADAVWTLAPSLESVLGTRWREEAEKIGASAPARVRNWAIRGAGRVFIPLAAAASLVAAIAVPQLLGPPSTEVRTAVAQTQILSLDDGSRVTVGARSNVQVQYAENERRVVLGDGQAFFEVAHDPARPFIVLAGNAEILVTGTRFDVRVAGDDVQVSVLEGRVELRRRPLISLMRNEAPARVLLAGQRSELEDGRTFSPEASTPVTPGEWRSGRLYYSEDTVGDIVADVQRYTQVPIHIADDRTASMRVTMSFRSNDLDGFVANLRSALPIESRRRADGGITLAAQ